MPAPSNECPQHDHPIPAPVTARDRMVRLLAKHTDTEEQFAAAVELLDEALAEEYQRGQQDHGYTVAMGGS